MVDFDDVELVALAGPGGLIGLLLVLVLAYYACENKQECAAKTCPGAMKPKLMEHECLCVEKAR